MSLSPQSQQNIHKHIKILVLILMANITRRVTFLYYNKDMLDNDDIWFNVV